MITYGDVSTGTIIVSGAVGELKHLEGGLKAVSYTHLTLPTSDLV